MGHDRLLMCLNLMIGLRHAVRVLLFANSISPHGSFAPKSAIIIINVQVWILEFS